MELILVRHAIAEDRDAARWPDDSLRPLTEKGRRKFRDVAKALGRIQPEVEVVLSSRWTRAWETAELLHEFAGWPAPTEFEPLELEAARRVIVSLKPHVDRSCIGLVGHEPQMSELLSVLLMGEESRVTVEFKKGGAACVEMGGKLQAGTATLKWLVPPR
ncbi:MAG: histidine phosphatase family protein, partial [Phycisphaerales bacterium]|nr:histidine phosphatase family protein [Phycisphaerales bacterium]MCI0675348.1 histidine phosphatase family protein [Phycisphaerales bacterium]